MNWIPWDDILRIGHAAIDADHVKMVRLFNRLVDAVKNQRPKSDCAKVLSDIIDHTTAHFALEAELMAKHRYPKAEEHNREHAQLVKQVLNYRTRFETGAPGSYIALIHFPEDWLTRHVVTSDKELAGFLAKVETTR